MFFRRLCYQVSPGSAALDALFAVEILTLQRRHGGRLVGRRATRGRFPGPGARGLC